MSEAVYPEFHKDGVRFQLHIDGKVIVWTKDLAPREFGRLGEDGSPWIPRHKNFNSLCRQWLREGDVDDLLAEQRRIAEARSLKRKAGEGLYEALDALLASHDDLMNWAHDPSIGRPDLEWSEQFANAARAVLAKARGEQP